MAPTPLPVRWKDIFGVWSVVGIVTCFQTYAIVDLPTETNQWWLDFLQLIYWQLSRAWLWALLTPLVWRLQEKIPITRYWLVPGVALHGFFCLVFVMWVLWVRHIGWMFSYVDSAWWLTISSIQYSINALSPRQYIDVVLYGGILAAGYMLRLNARRKEMEQQATQLREQLAQQQLQSEILRAELVDAQMKAHKERLHPHFLFNALNAVSGLVRRRDNERAVDALNRMSILLRGLLSTEARKLIPLEQELDYCRTYLDIEKLRFDEKLLVEFKVDPALQQALVPALLLQPLVENTIKHGISRRRSPGRVIVSARMLDDRLELTVDNDPAESLASATAPASHGIGLSTLRSRLEKTYGAGAEVSFTHSPPELTRLRLTLPLQFPAPTASAALASP
jgi:sensor histidine kinase YesM